MPLLFFFHELQTTCQLVLGKALLMSDTGAAGAAQEPAENEENGAVVDLRIKTSIFKSQLSVSVKIQDTLCEVCVFVSLSGNVS